ncbi:MAG: serpin family protein [Gemmatimonadales bacterium]
MNPRSFLLPGVVLAAAACQPGGDTHNNNTPPALIVALPRSLSASEQALITADNQLGFELLRAARAAAPDSNVLLSPLSAGMALGLTLNGSAGATLDSMRRALQLSDMPVATIDSGYRSLLDLLARLDGTTSFSIANSIWTDNSISFLASFLSAGKANFDAEIHNLDLQAPATVGSINDWASRKTKGMIPAIVSRIDPDEVMLLINAIAFKGEWRQGFDPAKTQPAPFTTSSGETQSVPTMTLGAVIGHAVKPDAELVELPYGDGAFALTIVLPAPGRSIGDLMNGLDAARFAGWVSQIGDDDLVLTLPRFRFQFERQLNDDLSALGMRVAFDRDAADFTRMATLAPPTRLYLTNVTQKTLVDVDEEGTTAAAVTSVGVARGTSRLPEVDVDRPFLFVLRERLSGTIFFVGQVNRIP